MHGWMVGAGSGALARRPPHTAPTENVDVDVVHRLASVRPIVDDNPVAFGKAGILSTLLCNNQHVAQQLRETQKE